MKFNVPYNYCGRTGTVFTEISQTVPDMSLSIREILANHVRGITDSVGDNGYYGYDAGVEDFDDIPANYIPMDLTEMDDNEAHIRALEAAAAEEEFEYQQQLKEQQQQQNIKDEE